MIFIAAKFHIKPEFADQWPAITADFTEATRSEDGCLWFDWSRSIDDPNMYVLIEAFRDNDAAATHVGSDHFHAAQKSLPRHLQATPHIINTTIDGTEWSQLGEMAAPQD